MGGHSIPGSLGLNAARPIDEGTLARRASHVPGTVGYATHSPASHHKQLAQSRPLKFTIDFTPSGTHDDGQAWRFSVAPDVGWLYDFKVNHAELRGAHKRYLDQVARRILADSTKDWCVQIQGRASRTGSDARNWTLSVERANAAHKYLKAQVPNASLIPYGVGETAATEEGDKDGKENMFQRAVLVSVWAVSRENKDKKKQPPPPPPPPDKEFQIRVLWGFSVGADVKVLSGGPYFMKLQIVDVEAKMACDYDFNGMGGSVSLGLGISSILKWLKRKVIPIPGYGAWIKKGSPQSFRVPRGWSLTHIEGKGKLLSLGPSAAGKSKGPTDFSFTYVDTGKLPYWQTVEHLDIRTWGFPSVGATKGDGPLTRSGEPYQYDGE